MGAGAGPGYIPTREDLALYIAMARHVLRYHVGMHFLGSLKFPLFKKGKKKNLRKLMTSLTVVPSF